MSENPLILLARNFFIRHIPESVAMQRMSFIYGWEP
jgi:hypothetical protein